MLMINSLDSGKSPLNPISDISKDSREPAESYGALRDVGKLLEKSDAGPSERQVSSASTAFGGIV
jgi:hypothetical protein